MRGSRGSRPTRSGVAHLRTRRQPGSCSTARRAASRTSGGSLPSRHREEDDMRKIFIHLIACSVALVFTVRVAHATDCNLSIPTPPNPVPSGFDWTPLAQNFCAQLAACGYSTPSCVSDYLSGVAGFPAPPGSGAEAFDTASTTDTLVCEDSDEYASGETTCCAPSCSGKACGADDGCGHSCCLQCTSCAPVSCGQCWVADACGAT